VKRNNLHILISQAIRTIYARVYKSGENAMPSLINTTIKPFKAKAYHNNAFVDLSDADLKGKWSVLFFYPADFTFVCPTELEDMAEHYEQFKSIGVEVYSVSTDTHFSHMAWHTTSPSIGKIKFPMLGDPTGTIARNFDVMIEDAGLALRGTFVINPEGVIKVCEIHDLGVGRSASELLRKVQAAQYVADHNGEVCPAKWTPGAASLKPSIDKVGKI
jgi:NADH-dependent peroxiredoxin subunit C